MKAFFFFLGMILPILHGELSASDHKIKVYFDLGETLIFKTDQNQWLLPSGTITYLKELKDQNIEISIISNVPDSWGDREEKISRLKATIAKNNSSKSPFPWHLFKEIYIPPNNQFRKPHPHLFELIKKAASPKDALVFIGENEKELEVAQATGFKTFRIDSKKSFFYPSLKTLLAL